MVAMVVWLRRDSPAQPETKPEPKAAENKPKLPKAEPKAND